MTFRLRLIIIGLRTLTIFYRQFCTILWYKNKKMLQYIEKNQQYAEVAKKLGKMAATS